MIIVPYVGRRLIGLKMMYEEIYTVNLGDKTKEMLLKMGDDGKFVPYNPYITVDFATEKDFLFVKEAIAKATATFVTCPKGFQGMRDTRYYCPACKKAVRRYDPYCHNCGQKVKYPKEVFDRENNKWILDWSE